MTPQEIDKETANEGANVVLNQGTHLLASAAISGHSFSAAKTVGLVDETDASESENTSEEKEPSVFFTTLLISVDGPEKFEKLAQFIKEEFDVEIKG